MSIADVVVGLVVVVGALAAVFIPRAEKQIVSLNLNK